MERSELRAGGSAGNAALAVSYLGGHSRLLSVVGSDDLGTYIRATRWSSARNVDLDRLPSLDNPARKIDQDHGHEL